jgi:hypothetical protein
MPTLHAALCCLLATAAGTAFAAGLGTSAGRPPQLGEPLDFAVQLRTDSGENLAPGCVGAEVVMGERRVPPVWVRTSLEVLGPELARVRVTTTQPIDEPVVTVNVGVGCTLRVSRRYVLLVEPPSMAPAVAAPAFAAAPPEVPAAMAAAGVPAGASTAPAASTSPAPSAPSAPSEALPLPALAGGTAAAANDASAAPARPRTTRSTGGDRRAAAGTPGRAAGPARARRNAPASNAPAAAKAGAARPRPPEPAPRLKLEPAEPPPPSPEAVAIERAIEAVAQAASAARAAASSASAASARVATLEGEITQLRAQSQAQGELAAQLREQLAASRSTSRWMLPLMGVVLALAALAMWLAWRLSAVQRQREAEWRQIVAPAKAPAAAPAQAVTTVGLSGEATPSRQPTAPIPFITSELAPGRGAAGRSRGASPAWPPPAPAPATVWPESVPPPAEQTRPLPRSGAVLTGADDLADEEPPRDVSIEELIDLEQQAEFFVVLGQDEAAVDLLVAHLRATGGGSPLPYLKLLEIYQRRGDPEAYERTRSRFNHRFNAYAPEWGADMGSGRSLQDYAGVVPRLQQVWARPLDAMAELEALLFRKSRGELFDLPAYREILFLYSIARDLLDREGAGGGNVDLLLPMSEDTAYGTTQAHPYLGLESDAMPLPRAPAADERPTAPLDLDLSGKRPSLFGEFDDKPRS